MVAWQVSYQNICYAKSFRFIGLAFFSSFTRSLGKSHLFALFICARVLRLHIY